MIVSVVGAIPLSASASALPSSIKGIVVTPPGFDAADAKAYATSHDKILLSDYLERTRPGDEHDQMLRLKLERAQRAWLAGNIEEARTEFRTISELSLKADWQTAQREVIQTADLRLAQTAESNSERDGWLETAARLYGDLSPAAALVPPPVLNQYSAVLKRLQAQAVDIDLQDIFPDFRYVLIDGRKFDVASESHLALTNGVHRLTALSDSREAVTEFMTPTQLRVLRLSPPALTEGVCETASLRSRSEIPSHTMVDIYSGENCPAKLSNLLSNSRLVSNELAHADSELRAPTVPQAEAGKKTWLWVVGGAVLAGAAYAIATHTGALEPTHKSGF